MSIDHGDDPLARATRLLRQHTDAGWTAISADILDRALRAFRPSEPVRGRHALGDFFVAAEVLVSRLREVVDTAGEAVATRITCATGDEHRLEAVTIEITAGYGTHLVTVADRIHAAAAEALADLLGDLTPGPDEIRTHVHIGDVTTRLDDLG